MKETNSSCTAKARVPGQWRLFAIVVALAACKETTGNADDRCPDATGEFGANDCAVLDGRAVTAAGVPLANIGIRADSVTATSYVFASASTRTAADGRFTLVVRRYDPVGVTRHVDSATVPVKAYLNDADPAPGQAEDLRAWVTVSMAPLGSPVDRTEGDFVFSPASNPRPGVNQ